MIAIVWQFQTIAKQLQNNRRKSNFRILRSSAHFSGSALRPRGSRMILTNRARGESVPGPHASVSSNMFAPAMHAYAVDPSHHTIRCGCTMGSLCLIFLTHKSNFINLAPKMRSRWSWLPLVTWVTLAGEWENLLLAKSMVVQNLPRIVANL